MFANIAATQPARRRIASRLSVAVLAGLSAWVLAFHPLCATAGEPTAAKAPPPTTKAPAATGKPAAKKPKSKAKAGGTAAELTQMLQAKGSAVQDCAVNHGLDKGASKVAIVTKVTINGRGQVINIQTTVNLDKGSEGDKVRDCVNELIKSIRFPESAAPMITIERNWTIQST